MTNEIALLLHQTEVTFLRSTGAVYDVLHRFSRSHLLLVPRLYHRERRQSRGFQHVRRRVMVGRGNVSYI